MGDRYRGYSSSGRSATFNPARTSLPASIGYTSLYAGDINVLPSSRHHTTPRGYTTSSTSSGVPTTTRTYAVTQDPRSSRPITRDISRHRSSTLDSSTARPPVIVMTTQGKERPHANSSHSSNARSGSPIRDDYRSSEGHFYTEPASSIRSRSSARPFAEQLDADEYTRIRERSDSLLRDDPYRGSRHSAIYPQYSRHGSSVVDYGDEGYKYTNAGELARYDLDNSSSTNTGRSRRRESIDRGYYRPTMTYNPDPRSSNPDANYNMNTGRHYESRVDPSSNRGYDRLPRDYYEPTSRDIPPAAPAPPDPTAATATAPQVEVAGSAAEGRRARPVSLYQEGPMRSNHHDDYYRSREDERNMRELRDREQESERAYDAPYFHDDSVTTRGFGIRTEQPTEDFDDRRERRREYRGEEPKKRSDDELVRDPELEREERRRIRRESKDGRRERRESKRGSDEDEKERSRFRDKMAAGLGIAATAMGLTPPGAKDDDKREKEKESRRRKGSDDERDKRKDTDDHDRPRASDRSRSRHRDHDRRDSKDESDVKERKRRDADSRKNGEVTNSSSESDEAKKKSRRHRASTAFDPNDTSDLKQIREQLATMKTSDKDSDKERAAAVETTRTRSASPVKDSSAKVISKDISPPQDEVRGRDVIVPSLEEREKQVRVVSPPRDKKEDKPIKGILKQPKASFPEEPNPIREGVAPHKEDKKIKDAPPGAKWTKISRKIVNPEALTIGKERYEIRDDFVIVLRVLSKEEIQTYAAATQVLRERRRRNEDGDRDYDHDRDRDRDDEDRRRHRRYHRHRDDDDDDRNDRDRDRERRRRHRDDDDHDHHHHHRSHRDRDAQEA